MLKKYLFKKEWENLEKEKLYFLQDFRAYQEVKKYEEAELEVKKKDFEDKKWELLRIYERSLQENTQETLTEYTGKLQEIYDYKLFPGAKVWIFEGMGTIFDKPQEVEIERVIFEKDKIRVDGFARFFYTEQEAIKAHNKEIKKLLLK